MKKKKIQLLVLVILCLLCVGAYVLVKNMDFAQEETLSAQQVTVTDFASGDVTALSVTGDHILNFVKEEEKWVNADDREMTLDQNQISSLVNNIAGLATESVVEEPENLSEYGLDNPVRTIKAEMKNGSSVIIYVGNQNDLTGDYYIRLEGDDRLYGISSYVVTAFDKDPEEFIEETTEETAEVMPEETAEESLTEEPSEGAD